MSGTRLACLSGHDPIRCRAAVSDRTETRGEQRRMRSPTYWVMAVRPDECAGIVGLNCFSNHHASRCFLWCAAGWAVCQGRGRSLSRPPAPYRAVLAASSHSMTISMCHRMLVGRPHGRRRITFGGGNVPSSIHRPSVARATPIKSQTWVTVSSLLLDIAQAPMKKRCATTGGLPASSDY